jgi:hypothetical protein
VWAGEASREGAGGGGQGRRPDLSPASSGGWDLVAGGAAGGRGGRGWGGRRGLRACGRGGMVCGSGRK